MPRKIHRRLRKARKVRGRARKGRVHRSLNPQNQFATTIETYEYGSFNANTLENFTFSLANFPRSQAVAACYKWYKPVEVLWEYTPLYNTFQDQQTSVGTSVPSFFSVMNRTQDSRSPAGVPNQLAFVESQGAKPRTFTKKITLKYKPNWCSPGLMAVQTDPIPNSAPTFYSMVNVMSMGLKAEYAWLQGPNRVDPAIASIQTGTALPGAQASQPTVDFASVNMVGGDMPPNFHNPYIASNMTNTTVFNGHDAFIRQDNTGQSTLIADVRVIVKWAFKNPNAQYLQYGDRVDAISSAEAKPPGETL
jgi:hypothetical protein